MIASSSPRLTCPLEEACKELSTLRGRVLYAMLLPGVLTLVSIVMVRRFDHQFLENPILVTILGLFLVGQAVLTWQLNLLRRRATTGMEVLSHLKEAGPVVDLRALETRLLSVQIDPMRDLVLSWIDLERHFEGNGGQEILQNSIDRRLLRDHTEIGVHAMLNRVVLKIGFLGTLIGLLFTFPPMKRAVLGLSGSGGEMTFIKDIAKAIDEDAYAIQATLVATGLSLLLETLVVQVLERFYGRFELVESLLSDWNLLVLRPSAKTATSGSVALIAEDNLRIQAKLAQGQQILDTHLNRLLETLQKTAESIEHVALSQADLEQRVSRIAAWERDYRDFLITKDRAASPLARAPEK